MTQVVTTREGAVQRIQLNRPEKKNALTADMYAAIAEAVRGADSDPGLRVSLIHGAGDAFTADFSCERERAAIQREIDRLQGLGSGQHGSEINLLLNQKRTLARRIEELT